MNLWDYTDEIHEITMNDEQPRNVNRGKGTTHYAEVSVQKEIVKKPVKKKPEFLLERVKYEPHKLTQMVVSNKIVCMVQRDNHVIRLDLENPQDIQDIEISKKVEEKIHKIFLDPTGTHLIISMEHGENFYLHSTWRKAKPLAKAKNVVIESIAWSINNKDKATTDQILVGAKNGLIYETNIESTERFLSNITNKLFTDSKEKYWKQIYNLKDKAPVTGLFIGQFPGTQSTPKYFLVVTTPTKIYQFIGGPTYENIFVNYETPEYQEMPGNLNYSELHFYRKYQDSLPEFFCWMTNPGLFHGTLTFGSQNSGEQILTDNALLQYPTETITEAGPAIGMAITEFHFLVVYRDRLQVLSRFSEQVVFTQIFPHSAGELKGISQDQTTKKIWIYSVTSLFELTIRNESENIWKFLLKKGKFEEALNFCKKTDLKQRETIYSSQADHYFDSGNYDLAARYYGKTTKQFEEVVLKFLQIGQKKSLKQFLLAKLEHLKDSPKATQKNIIATWLVEIYLGDLVLLKNLSRFENEKEISEEFFSFLNENKSNLNYNTISDLISSHGRIEELMSWATINNDYEKLIQFNIQKGFYSDALRVLCKQTKPEIFYKYSPVLILHVAEQTVNSWITSSSILNPSKLIPSLMKYNATKEGKNFEQSIRYLQHCVTKFGNVDPVVHNFLLSLYVKLESELPLINFVSQKNIYFDLKYALRLCIKYKKIKTCVLIYSAMHLYEEAVDLALTVDLSLAKTNADKPEDDEELRKKLWLRIAKNVVSEEQDIKKAMEFLKECSLIKIEDVLPFFSNFTVIDYFKEEICNSLSEYNSHIEELKEEMEEATLSADMIRNDLKMLRNRFGCIDSKQYCQLCSTALLTKQFYIFPCMHCFHSDCLLSFVSNHLNNFERKRLFQLQDRIREQESLLGRVPVKTNLDDSISFSENSQLELDKAEFDNILAAECVTCGSFLVNSIDLPLISNQDRKESETWFV